MDQSASLVTNYGRLTITLHQAFSPKAYLFAGNRVLVGCMLVEAILGFPLAYADESPALAEITEANGYDQEEFGIGVSDLLDMSVDEDLLIYALESEAIVTSATLGEHTVRTAPAIMTKIGSEQIRLLGLNTLRDALQLVAGISVLDFSSGSSEVALRAVANSPNILVTMDGQSLNNFYEGSFLLDLPLADIESIEIIRGPGSALYGTNAFSGVISIVSRAWTDETGVNGSFLVRTDVDDGMGYGGAGNLRYSAAYNGWGLGVSGSYFQTTGPKVLVERDNTEAFPYTQVPGYTNRYSRFALTRAGLSKTDLFLNEDSFNVGTYFLADEHGPYFGQGRSFATDSDFTTLNSFTYAAYSGHLNPRIRLNTRISFDVQSVENNLQDEPDGYYFDANRDMVISDDEIFPEGKRRYINHVSRRFGANSFVAYQRYFHGILSNYRLLLGASLEFDTLPKFEYLQNYEAGLYRSEMANWDDFLLDQQGRNRLVYAPYLQQEMHLFGSLWLTLGLRWDFYSDFGNSLNPRAALVWQALDSLSFKALYGSAFRAPTFEELYDRTSLSEEGRLIRGDSELKPETTDTFEAGLDWTPTKHLSLRSTVFYLRTNDVIDIDMTYNRGNYNLINYPGQEAWGSEHEIQLLVDCNNYLSANLMWISREQLGEGIEGWEHSGERLFMNKELTDLPQLRINSFLITQPLPWLNVGLRYSFVGSSEGNRRFTNEMQARFFERSSYHQVGGRVATNLKNNRLDIWLTTDRILNKNIPLTVGFERVHLSAPSWWSMVGATYRF